MSYTKIYSTDFDPSKLGHHTINREDASLSLGVIAAFLFDIHDDYDRHFPVGKKPSQPEIYAEVGSVYIRVVRGGSVHSFIVRKDNGKFKAGDILKSASWRAPAKNYVRGNIFTGYASGACRWTGAA